jgi:hypothetical protein
MGTSETEAFSRYQRVLDFSQKALWRRHFLHGSQNFADAPMQVLSAANRPLNRPLKGGATSITLNLALSAIGSSPRPARQTGSELDSEFGERLAGERHGVAPAA